MNTLRIHKVLTKHVKFFQGVYQLDLLPSTLIKPSIIIVNLDKYYMPGSHWVAVCFSESGYAEYFDSYGISFKLEITAYLLRHSISRTFNRHGLQDLTSNVCGHYSYFHTLHRASGLSMTSFVNMFVLLATPATIKRRCACSELSLACVPLATIWCSSSRVSHKYK